MKANLNNKEFNAIILAYRSLCNVASLYTHERKIYDRYMENIKLMQKIILKINCTIKFDGLCIMEK
jgi:hypothetical protein